MQTAPQPNAPPVVVLVIVVVVVLVVVPVVLEDTRRERGTHRGADRGRDRLLVAAAGGADRGCRTPGGTYATLRTTWRR